MLKSLRLPASAFPLALLALGLVSFGLLIPWMGFYWDDWPAVWYTQVLGSQSFPQVFAIDRPLLGWMFQVTTALLGTSALGWQVFAILARWLSAAAFWLTLRTAWPRFPWQANLAAALFIVYPGFKQQHLAVTYSHGWLLMAAFFASLWLMLLAARQPRRFWLFSGLGWLLAAFSLFTAEYYAGLELLRPALLWLALDNGQAERRLRLRQAVLHWLPYLALLAAFLVWRVALVETPRGEVRLFDLLARDPLGAARLYALTIGQDLLETSLGAWGQVAQLGGLFDVLAGFNPLALGLPLLAAAGTALALAVFPAHPPAPEPADRWGWQAVALGGYALLAGGWPFWATDLPIRLEFPWDRFTLPMMTGAALLLAGLIVLLSERRSVQIVLASVLIGLAAGVHFQNAIGYVGSWNLQRSFFWQLAWRAPGLQPGAILMTDTWNIPYTTDNSLTAPLNWIYNPGSRAARMDYMMLYLPVRLGDSLESLRPGTPVEEDYRATFFKGTTANALVFDFQPPGCLRILDPALDREIYEYPSSAYRAIDLSRLELVIADPPQPASLPAELFGSPPQPDWCYYYQKAMLAWQERDWARIVTLADRASNDGYLPHSAAETLPLIEAYAHQGNWKKASNLTRNALERSYTVRPALCLVWSRLAAETDPDPGGQSALQDAFALLDCPGQ